MPSNDTGAAGYYQGATTHRDYQGPDIDPHTGKNVGPSAADLKVSEFLMPLGIIIVIILVALIIWRST